MKLWLDDERPAPEGWLGVKTVQDAIKFASYETVVFEACSLDHDLGQGDNAEGIAFIDWMIANNVWPKSRPVVHSMNPVGRKRMVSAINRYYPGES